ncbi:MAG TPA: copper resistance protein CopC [Tepidiformaceae bacterium]|nr:copper resistance protein CopC [Tepidiformaceae bacterium]
MKRAALFVLMVVCLGALTIRPEGAVAHATLVAASPAENGFLQTPPERISLTFSEPLDQKASGIQLLDSRGQPIALAPVEFPEGSPTTMRVALPTLEPGIYNVLWANVSTVDGHPINGLYPFTVLNPDGSVPEGTNAVGSGGSGNDPAPIADSVAVRALLFLALLMVMAPGVVILVSKDRFPASVHAGLQWVAMGGVLLLALGLLLNLELLRTQYGTRGLWDTLISTRAGGAWWARVGAALLAGITILGMRHWPGPAALRLVACGVAVMGSFALTSHAGVGPGRAWATVFDILHGSAALIWVSGVIGLVLLARLAGREAEYRELIPRFSLMASIAVFVLIVTGLLNAFVQIDTPGRLTETRYGLTTLVKLAVTLPLLALAGWNATRGKRSLIELRKGEPRRFIATAGAEAMLGIAVIALAATLSQTTAAKLVVDDTRAGPYLRAFEAADLDVTLSIDPNETGLNTFEVTLRDAAGELVEADLVRITFRYQEDSAVGPSELALAQGITPGIYGGRGPYLPLEGNWRVEVDIRRADTDDTTAFFDVRPAGQPVTFVDLGSRFDNPAPGLTWNELGGFIVTTIGLGFALWRDPLSRTGRFGFWTANVMTVTGFAVGTLLFFGVHAHTPPGASLTNPIFPDQASVGVGQRIFQQNCASCHGVNGVPPSGLDLNPYPLDLTVHVPQHTDGVLYTFLDQGVTGSAMIGWGREGLLSTEEIWHLVNYLRTLRVPDR